MTPRIVHALIREGRGNFELGTPFGSRSGHSSRPEVEVPSSSLDMETLTSTSEIYLSIYVTLRGEKG